jgi:hypothetical protein
LLIDLEEVKHDADRKLGRSGPAVAKPRTRDGGARTGVPASRSRRPRRKYLCRRSSGKKSHGKPANRR